MNASRRRLGLHWKIVIGLVLGALFGGIVNAAGLTGLSGITTEYIRPVGTLFIRLITMIAAPLVVTSLIVGASSIADPRKLGRIGIRTILLYVATTAVAISIGLAMAWIIQPGAGLPEATSRRLLESYSEQAGTRIEGAEEVSAVDAILEIVPTNPFAALASGSMLQIVFFALIVGLALTMIKSEKARPVIQFFDGFTDVLIRIVEMVMLFAPYGVFALIAAVTADFGFGILSTLSWYALAVVLGLVIHMFVVYGSLLKSTVGAAMPLGRFFKSLLDVHLLAFSSSSSAATLPLNMEVTRDRLGVSERITSFVLPLGATMNMDGTALYQGVAAVFIAQVYGLPLTFLDQVVVVLTATLASIGTAAVPGAGVVMLVIVLNAIGVPVEGIALIMGIDRILDMCRTVVNVTGDATVATVVAHYEGELGVIPSRARAEDLKVAS